MFIKADVQGYELRVLSGMDGLGVSVVGGQIEVNLRPLYEGQPSLQDALSALEERGFRIAGVANGGFEPSGEESYIDIMFVRV